MTDSTNITKDIILNLTRLARLRLEEAEVKNGTNQLNHALQHFAMIQGIKTEILESSFQRHNITRADIAQPDILCATDQLVKNAPQSYKGQIKVKAVFS